MPPYNVLIDTNFLSHTVQRKLELLPAMMDCLYASCRPIIVSRRSPRETACQKIRGGRLRTDTLCAQTSCVMAELEKLGAKYRIALRIARDERWERLQCDHKGVYADDCIVDR